jgi:hypothetical protein
MKDQVDPITPAMAAGLSALQLGAQRVIACALTQLPTEERNAIQAAVDSEQCALTLQIDFPSCAVRVLADGQGWLKPRCLMALELPEPVPAGGKAA